jgi:hypothetical protein
MKVEDDTKAQLDEITKQLEEMKEVNERLRIEKEAAENLLRGVERVPSQSQQSYIAPDRNVDQGKLVRDAMGINVPPAQQEFDKAMDEQLQNYLKRFTPEQLQDPETLRSILYEFGKNIGGFAYQNATRTALDIFQKSVEVKNNIDAIIGDWRKRHPDLANKEDEDLVEYILMKKIANDPVHRGKHLSVLLDIATEQAVQLKSASKGGGKLPTEPRTTPLTVRPSRISAPAGGTREEPEEPGEPLNDVDKFFQMRQRMNSKRQWTGRPSS